MTMIFTQQPAMINISDRTACADHFVLPPRSASAKLPTFEPIPRVHAPAPYERSLGEKRSSVELGDQPHILAPCPKKPAVVCPSIFFAGTPYQSSLSATPSVQQQDYWGLWAVPEVISEDEVTGLNVERHEATHSFEAAACAELLEIMSNSRGSSRSSSKATSPLLAPEFEIIDDYVVEAEYLPEPTQAVPISALHNAHLLMVDDLNASTALFGTSPIVRTRNPLPNDSSFHPMKTESIGNYIASGSTESASAHALPLSRSRRILGETDMNTLVMHHSKLCDAVSEMHVASKSETRSALQAPSGAPSATFAVRPRSYSVGDKRNNFAIAL